MITNEQEDSIKLVLLKAADGINKDSIRSLIISRVLAIYPMLKAKIDKIEVGAFEKGKIKQQVELTKDIN